MQMEKAEVLYRWKAGWSTKQAEVLYRWKLDGVQCRWKRRRYYTGGRLYEVMQMEKAELLYR